MGTADKQKKNFAKSPSKPDPRKYYISRIPKNGDCYSPEYIDKNIKKANKNPIFWYFLFWQLFKPFVGTRAFSLFVFITDFFVNRFQLWLSEINGDEGVNALMSMFWIVIRQLGNGNYMKFLISFWLLSYVWICLWCVLSLFLWWPYLVLC